MAFRSRQIDESLPLSLLQRCLRLIPYFEKETLETILFLACLNYRDRGLFDYLIQEFPVALALCRRGDRW
jgi:hypothetical protein